MVITLYHELVVANNLILYQMTGLASVSLVGGAYGFVTTTHNHGVVDRVSSLAKRAAITHRKGGMSSRRLRRRSPATLVFGSIALISIPWLSLGFTAPGAPPNGGFSSSSQGHYYQQQHHLISSFSSVPLPTIKPRGDQIRTSARKRSKVNIGSEEIQYFHDMEYGEDDALMMMGGDSIWDEEEEVGGGAAAVPAAASGGSRKKRFVNDKRLDDNDYLNRDRRVMKMGEDERAYYDRLNAYKSDKQRKIAAAIPPSASASMPSSTAPLPEALIAWNGEMPEKVR